MLLAIFFFLQRLVLIPIQGCLTWGGWGGTLPHQEAAPPMEGCPPHVEKILSPLFKIWFPPDKKILARYAHNILIIV